MSRQNGILILVLILAGLFPHTLLAQYIYVDANGNGVHDAADIMSANGVPTTIDVYLNTNHNRDGSLAQCDTGDGDIGLFNSYAVHMNAQAGTVTFSSPVNRVTQFTIACVEVGTGFKSNSTEMSACWASGFPRPGGLVRLFTVTVTGQTGTPNLEFVPMNTLDQNFTAFGTPCSGNDFDNTYKLGSDWFDADGLSIPCGANCPPSLAVIYDMAVNEGETASQTITASDTEGQPIQFQKVAGPPFMTVVTTDPNAGIGGVVLTPSYSDAGSGIQASVRATDGLLASPPRSFLITVHNVNRAPVANPGGPYAGTPGVVIGFDGTGSIDPDGDALTFAWNFGDLMSGVGPTPAHTYAAVGSYVVGLAVSDGGLQGTATTTATIADLFVARAFTTRANRLLRLGSGKPTWSIEIEPIARSFAIGQVDLATVRMKSSGTGTVAEVHAATGKTAVVGDADGNGTGDFSAIFRRQDLQSLFAYVTGSTTVPVTIEGDIITGGTFRAQADLGVVASGGPAAVSVVPNPLNPTGVVRLVTRSPGRIRVELFDTSGKLIRVLAEEEVASARAHSYVIDGLNHDGGHLASGIYYVRVATPDGIMTRRFAILK